MRYSLILLAAPLGIALAQPAQSAQKPAPKTAAVDVHVARHPKAKPAPAVRKRVAPETNRAAVSRVADSAATIVVPLPTLRLRAKTLRSTPPKPTAGPRLAAGDQHRPGRAQGLV